VNEMPEDDFILKKPILDSYEASELAIKILTKYGLRKIQYCQHPKRIQHPLVEDLEYCPLCLQSVAKWSFIEEHMEAWKTTRRCYACGEQLYLPDFIGVNMDEIPLNELLLHWANDTIGFYCCTCLELENMKAGWRRCGICRNWFKLDQLAGCNKFGQVCSECCNTCDSGTPTRSNYPHAPDDQECEFAR